MAVRVERNTEIEIQASALGTEGTSKEHIYLREGDMPGHVMLSSPKYGTEVSIDDLMEGLGKAQEEFPGTRPPLRAA